MDELLVTVDHAGRRLEVAIPRNPYEMNRVHAAGLARDRFHLPKDRRYELRRPNGTELDAIRAGDELELIERDPGP